MEILTVTQLNQALKRMLSRVPVLQNLCVRGELSNYKVYPSGHHYFTLKDAEGALKCVMFRGSAQSLRFKPQNGMAVLATGRLDVYPRDGVYQLYCERLVPDGAGDLQLAFEAMKQRLYAEGLFAPQHKRPLPPLPGRIAIVTSPAGAAVHDMLRILGRRFPLAKVLLLPVRVQGEEAAGEIAAAIAWANEKALADLLIVGRGGGSMEDLWAFNEEIVARAIYASKIPVISAVGHEPDVTISDFVADLRAATPSNAAELAVPDREELQARLEGLRRALAAALERRAVQARRSLEALEQRPVLRGPQTILESRRQRVDRTLEALVSAQEKRLADSARRLASLAAALDAMSPLKVLSRGYALVTDEAGTPLPTAAAARAHPRLDLRYLDGTLRVSVEEDDGDRP